MADCAKCGKKLPRNYKMLFCKECHEWVQSNWWIKDREELDRLLSEANMLRDTQPEEKCPHCNTTLQRQVTPNIVEPTHPADLGQYETYGAFLPHFDVDTWCPRCGYSCNSAIFISNGEATKNYIQKIRNREHARAPRVHPV